MTTDTDLPILSLAPGQERRFRRGHPWIYSNEIRMTPAARALPPGTLVRVTDSDGSPLATAGFNPHTLIAGRRLGPADATIDRDFVTARLAAALALRERLFPTPHYRLVHAEADGLPAIIVDRFGDSLVIQTNAAMAETLLPVLVEALTALLQPARILLRNDSPVRGLEGLPEHVELLHGPDARFELVENGARFAFDGLDSQKTGWFYDQRDNRAFVAGLAQGASMLDAYCYAGAFGIQAAIAGATAVTLLDRSAPALDTAMANAALNGVADKVSAVRGDVFTELARMRDQGRQFDVVMVDPPAFIKSRKDMMNGLQGYRKLAKLAALLVAPGGFQTIASSSHQASVDDFSARVADGITDARRQGRLLRTGFAGADHPVHPLLPESGYLKALSYQLD